MQSWSSGASPSCSSGSNSSTFLGRIYRHGCSYPRLETELKDAEELLEKIEQENADLSKDLEEAYNNAQDLDDERREGKVQISALEKELESAIDLNEVADRAKEVTALQTALTAAKKEAEEAVAEVAALKQEKYESQAAAEAKTVEKEGESEATSKRLTQLQNQVALLQQEKEKGAAKVMELQDEAKGAERREEALMKDLDEARAVNTKSKQNKDRTEALSARVASLRSAWTRRAPSSPRRRERQRSSSCSSSRPRGRGSDSLG